MIACTIPQIIVWNQAFMTFYLIVNYIIIANDIHLLNVFTFPRNHCQLDLLSTYFMYIFVLVNENCHLMLYLWILLLVLSMNIYIVMWHVCITHCNLTVTTPPVAWLSHLNYKVIFCTCQFHVTSLFVTIRSSLRNLQKVPFFCLHFSCTCRKFMFLDTISKI